MKTLLITYKIFIMTLAFLPLSLCSNDDDTPSGDDDKTDLFTDVAVVKKIYQTNGLDVSDPRWDSKNAGEVTDLMFDIGCEVRNGRLTNLSVIHKGLTTIPTDIKKLDAAKKLSFGENSLSSLPKEIGEMSNLEEVYLYSNSLSSLPSEFGNLKKLLVLDLQFNNFTALPEAISNLESLREIKITGIDEIPVFMTEIGTLTYVYFSYSDIQSLPKEIGQFPNLEYLYISECPNLTEVPKEIGQLSKLKKLLIGRCQLNSLPDEMGQLGNLEWLSLSWNNLETVPDGIGNLSKLKYLSVSYNPLKCLPQSVWDSHANNVITELLYDDIAQGDTDCSK